MIDTPPVSLDKRGLIDLALPLPHLLCRVVDASLPPPASVFLFFSFVDHLERQIGRSESGHLTWAGATLF